MKCTKCNMEIAYSYLDGFFCSCGFFHFALIATKGIIEQWNGFYDKIIEMRKKCQIRPFSNL